VQSLQFGDIVLVRMVDPNGVNEKVRRAVVLTSNEELQRDGPIIIAAISGTLPEELTADHILLPWHRDGHPRTGLTKRVAVICSWLARVDREAIERISGRVPGAQLKEIAIRTRELAEQLLGDS
jgi:mRNA-degrading endonuclease toxin of MazEF toxin-antitoxin module